MAVPSLLGFLFSIVINGGQGGGRGAGDRKEGHVRPTGGEIAGNG